MKKRRLVCAVLSVLMLAPVLAGCSGGKEKVVIYTSMEDYRNEELDKQLKEKFPDYDIAVQYLATGNNAAKIKSEGTKTEADIVLGLETASYLPIAGNFAKLDGFTKNEYLDEYVMDDDRCFIWEKFEGAFIINTEVFAEKNLEEPKTYADLLKPEYKDLIVMPDPKVSGTGYMFLNTWVNTMGKDEAFAYVDKLQENIKDFTKSGSEPIKRLNMKEAAIGIGMIFQAVEQINSGMPLKIIVPEDGAPYNTTIYGIIKGKEERESVKKVFEFINTEFMQYDKQNYAPGKILKEQPVKIQNYPADIKSADMSTISDADFKQELLAMWKY